MISPDARELDWAEARAAVDSNFDDGGLLDTYGGLSGTFVVYLLRSKDDPKAWRTGNISCADADSTPPT